MLTGIAVALLVPAIQVATAGADPITFDENSIPVPSRMVVSAPDASGAHQNWQAFATNSSGEDQEVQAFAICKV